MPELACDAPEAGVDVRPAHAEVTGGGAHRRGGDQRLQQGPLLVGELRPDPADVLVDRGLVADAAVLEPPDARAAVRQAVAKLR